MSAVEKFDILERSFSKRIELKATSPRSGLVSKEKKKKRWDDEHRKLYI